MVTCWQATTQVGQYLYVVGGWTGGAPTGLTTTTRLDMSSAPGVWENGPAFTMGRADFGLAYDAGTNKLYALGGDTQQRWNFFDSTNEVDELAIGKLACWNLGDVATKPATASPSGQSGRVLRKRGYLECRRHKWSNVPVPQ